MADLNKYPERYDRAAAAIKRSRVAAATATIHAQNILDELQEIIDALPTIETALATEHTQEVTRAIARVEEIRQQINGLSIASYFTINLQNALDTAWRALP